MGIYIRGMEMPKACMECPLETDYGTCGYYSLYVEAGHESDCEKRRDDCPLIEIQSHGDLIDRDELLSQYGGPIWTAKTDYAEGLRDVVADIKYAAAIIGAEPPTGCEDCKYWDGERCANSNRNDCHNSILWWPKDGE